MTSNVRTPFCWDQHNGRYLERASYFVPVITHAHASTLPFGKRSLTMAITSAFTLATVSASAPLSAATTGAATSVCHSQNCSGLFTGMGHGTSRSETFLSPAALKTYYQEYFL